MNPPKDGIFGKGTKEQEAAKEKYLEERYGKVEDMGNYCQAKWDDEKVADMIEMMGNHTNPDEAMKMAQQAIERGDFIIDPNTGRVVKNPDRKKAESQINDQDDEEIEHL